MNHGRLSPEPSLTFLGAAGTVTGSRFLVEAAGGRVVLVEGDPRNRKITDRHDLQVAELLLAELG